MTDYSLISKQNSRFHVRLADCDLDHAKSVLEQLKAEPSAPDDIVLVEDSPSAPPAQKNWLRRLLANG